MKGDAMSYLCVSHAAEDQSFADRFCRELAKYGFSYACIDENTAKERRETLFSGCVFLIVLTSPRAALCGSCATDLRRAVGGDKRCLCVSLTKNELDERFCGSEDAVLMIPYPAGETDTPDERSEALFFHRLYIRRLSYLSDCFSPVRCVDDAAGRAMVFAHKARLGDAEAQFALGEAYTDGIGVPVMESEAAFWIGRAAANHHVDAMIRLGELRLDGEGIERDPAEALRLFSLVAQLGDPRGQFAKAICCLYGYGVMKDPEMALRYFNSAASDGYIPAFYRLGLLYRDGLGVEANRETAIQYLYTAAVGREKHPPYLYGRRMAPVEGKKKRFVCVSMRFMRQKKLDRILWDRFLATFGEDALISKPLSATEEAERKLKFCKKYVKASRVEYPENLWMDERPFEKETARKNDYSHQAWNPALAESALGRLLELGSAKDGIRPSPRGALMWYRRSVKHGHVGAIFRLGDAYRSGLGIPSDPCQAVKMFRRAAASGSHRGQFALGVCYERGEGIERNLTEAVKWYELAAKNGYAPAQNNLGGCYENGIGVEVDDLSAVEWYNRASAEGEPNATCRLGLCYENGRGVIRNDEQAFRLYEDAARQKHPYALYRLGLFYDRGIIVSPQVTYAAHLYERAAMSGVGDAAYAMALCCREGRGIRRRTEDEIQWIKTAAKRGSVQGCYLLGMAYYEGKIIVQNKQEAMEAFRRAVELYEAMSLRARENAERLLPVDGMTLTEAVGKSLYMLGYGCITDHNLPEEARAYFEQSSTFGCGEAMVAIGDLYAFDHIGAKDEDDRLEKARLAYEAAAKHKRPEGVLSLALYDKKRAEFLKNNGDAEGEQACKEQAFQLFTYGETLGSKDAMIELAGCYWFGCGVKRNRNKAFERLSGMTKNSADKDAQGHVDRLAWIWMGDLYMDALRNASSVTDDVSCIKMAYTAYKKAADLPLATRQDDAYLLPARLNERYEADKRVKAEAQYRLAVLGMQYFKDGVSEQGIKEPLGAAVLAGHTMALEDLTRLYFYEKQYRQKEQSEAGTSSPKRGKLFGKKNRAETVPMPMSERELLWNFGKLYYDALQLISDPFVINPPRVTGDLSILPSEMAEPLTDTGRAEALNRLGDQYFYGRGVSEDRTLAVACYRRAASTAQKRGEPVSGGIVWAQYSLGYCLLHGIGVKKNPAEAVRYLTLAAKYHGQAAMCLADCHLSGTGVDRADRIEALKFYRRALKFGVKEALEHITRLEAQIEEEG